MPSSPTSTSHGPPTTPRPSPSPSPSSPPTTPPTSPPVMNSFHVFEAPYLNLISRFIRSWTLGLVQLPVQSDSHSHSVISWLDARPPGSVVYICFGNLDRFTPVYVCFEAAECPFMWVIKKEIDASSECLLEGSGEGRNWGLDNY